MSTFCSRRVVFNRDNEPCSYELLIDNEDENQVNEALNYICNYATEGLLNFTNNKKAFVKFKEISIVEEIPELIGKDNVIVNISGELSLNEESKKSLIKLFNNSFQIAYDITNVKDNYKEVEDFVHIYRIDFKSTTMDDREKILNNIFKLKNKHGLMAFNIINIEEYMEALQKGYEYFSGDYFSKPMEIKKNTIEIQNSTKFSILIELLNENLEIDRIENVVKSDASISYKLIKFLNSPIFGFKEKIKSIRQAIMLLGKKELRKWLTLIIVSDIQSIDNMEAVNSTVIRAKFCELIANSINNDLGPMAFMVGLFSDFQSYIDRDISDIVTELNFHDDIKDALLGKENTLFKILALEKSYEKMDVKNIKKYSLIINVDENLLFEFYSKSIEWLNESKINFNKM